MDNTVSGQREQLQVVDGFMVFAGVMFLVGAAANLIWGLGALDAKSYLPESGLLFSSLETWGWVSILWAAACLLTGVAVLAGANSAVPMGITVAGISAVFWLFALPVLPIFALVVIAIDALIIYQLAIRV